MKFSDIYIYRIMLITFNPITNRNYSKSSHSQSYRLPTLKCDTVSFSAMTKFKFKGFDLECINRFKAPIEKFNSNDDLQNWAAKELNTKSNLENFRNNIEADTEERNVILTEWINYLKEKIKPAASMVIFESITKEIKPNNKEIPVVFSPKALTDTLEQIENNGNFSTIFNDVYKSNLIKHFTNSDTTTPTKWVKISKTDKQDEFYQENVNKLKTLSRREWCVKSGSDSEKYVAKGPFYVLLKEGKTKAAVHIDKTDNLEIQGRRNNSLFPLEYLDEIEDICKKENIIRDFSQERISKIEFDNLKTKLSEAIKTNDRKTIFKTLGIKSKIDKQGRLYLDKYEQPSNYFTYEDLGIDENKLLKGIVRIKGNADFRDSLATDLSTLQSIGGNADFTKSGRIRLDSLKLIGKNGLFEESKISSLPALEKVNGILYFDKSEIKEAPKLKSVGQSLCLGSTMITKLPSLKNVGKKIFINNSYFKPEDFAKVKVGERICA